MTIKQKTDLRNLMENYYHAKSDLELAKEQRAGYNTIMKLARETDMSFIRAAEFVDSLIDVEDEQMVDLTKKVHIQFISQRNVKHTGFFVPQRDPSTNKVGKIIVCDDKGDSGYNAWDYGIVFFGDSRIVPISRLNSEFHITITSVEYR